MEYFNLIINIILVIASIVIYYDWKGMDEETKLKDKATFAMLALLCFFLQGTFGIIGALM